MQAIIIERLFASLSILNTDLGKKKILFFSAGLSPYDDFFLQKMSDYFEVEYATFNSTPTVRTDISKNTWVMGSRFAPNRRTKIGHALIYLLGSLEAKTVIRRTRPAIIIGNYASSYGNLCAKLKFHPNVLFVYGSDVLVEPYRSRFKARAVKNAISKADLIFLDSAIQEHASIALGADPEKIVRFPWIDAKMLIDHRSKSTLAHKQFNENQNRVILCTRSHEPVYQVDMVILAFSSVRKRFPDVRLRLAGAGSLTPKLKTLVKNLGLSNCVEFMGRLPRDRVIELYDFADVYVSASTSDGTSASLIEAMCRGTPVIVSKIPGNEEWIQHGKNGFLFDPHNRELLVEQMENALNLDKKKKDKIVSEARNIALAKASWQNNQFKLYNRILELTKNNN